MANNQTRQARLSWVRGNDVLLKVWLQERCLNDQGEEELRPFLVETAEQINVRLASLNYNIRSFDLEFANGEDNNEIVVDIQDTIPNGYYSLEVTAIVNGRDVRSFESCLLQIVESNQEAKTVLTPIASGREASVEITIQMVSSAMARGKNAYELWLDEGNVGSLQDFLNTFTNEGHSIIPKEGETTIIDATEGKYYRIDQPINELRVNLPSMDASVSIVKSICFYVKTGEHSRIHFTSSDNKPIIFEKEYLIEPNNTYEIYARYNGRVWVINNIALLEFFLFVRPEEVQWVTQGNDTPYDVQSNTNWDVT